ncbi:MAG TPA: hypothetical protein VN764_02330 [Polyangiaceae bacterium]|nr:hypothetical protein [Polyangiaceae bacterium]
MTKKAAAYSVLVGALLSACFPPAQPADPVEAPQSVPTAESDQASGIPWAPGEGPGETREVGEQPQSADEPMAGAALETTQEDGISQSGTHPGCTGKAPVPLKAEVQARIAGLKDCSQAAPPEFRGEGELKYTVRVEKDGSVSTIYQLSDTLRVAPVTQCVEAKLRQPFAEHPVQGCAQFVIPYQLLIEAGPSE